jgi:hypothetical protein
MKLRYALLAALAGAATVLLASTALGLAGSGKALRQGPFFSVLTGQNEISATTGKRGAGDADGRGGATAVIDGDQFCWGIVVKNLDQPILAHVHKGTKHENGPVVIPLTPPSNGAHGASSGCATIATDLADAIRSDPKGYYFNVHTTAFPGGAIRGQIFSRGH